jgi:formylmethanofuran dehydrogenase subunit B
MFTKNIICPVCGGSCDDIQVELGDGKITVKNACKMGNAKFQEVVSSHRLRDPLIKENGELKKADWKDAITKAAEILTEADRPLLFLGSETSCEAQEIGLHIGEYLGAAVDSNATICHGPTVMGIQESGCVGSTAGQTKNRANLSIYWGCNALESMPRHQSRYGIFPRGYWTKRGRFDRTVICVDPRKTPTAKAADLFMQLNPNSDYELFNALQTILNGKEPHPSAADVTGVPISTMKEMVEMMKACNFGAIYVGLGVGSSYGKHRNVEAALNLVKELNNHTKFSLGALRGHCNVAGFNQIASYLYGYPFGLDFARGYPRFNPGEYTTVDVLRDRDVDAAFVMCADLVCHIPADPASYLCEIPLVCLDIAPCPI